MPPEGFSAIPPILKERGPAVSIEKTERGTFLTDPPFHSVSAETVRYGKREELEQLLKQLIVRLEGDTFAVEQLLVPEAQEGLGDGRKYMWTKDGLMRMAALALDGWTYEEMIKFFNVGRKEEDQMGHTAMRAQISRNFSERGKRLIREAARLRQWQSLIHPEDKRLAHMVEKISERLGLPPGRIFRNRFLRSEEAIDIRPPLKERAHLYKNDIAIEVLFQRFQNKKTGKRLEAFAAGLISDEVTAADLAQFYRAVLTPEALALAGIGKEARGLRAWSAEEYRTVAYALIEDRHMVTKELGKLVGRTGPAAIGELKQEGARLVKQEQFKELSPIAAFVYRHGDLESKPNGKELAREIALAFSDRRNKVGRGMRRARNAA